MHSFVQKINPFSGPDKRMDTLREISSQQPGSDMCKIMSDMERAFGKIKSITKKLGENK